MHTHRLADWTHEHVFDSGGEAAEKGTRRVMWITAATMVVEIVAGWWFNSMALLADGWHMSSHALAIGLSAFAYATARRYHGDPRFSFGTWKIEVLGGFSSALFLLGIAALMVSGSLERMISPQEIHYQQAIAVAVIGLVVNLLCALILGKAQAHEHHHHHGHAQAHHGHHHHHDLNLKSAYVHVITDAATSILAIGGLIGGWIFGWAWLDPLMGIVGAVLVALWSKGLLIETGKVLLDREMDHPIVGEIREALESGLGGAAETRITDLHVWRVGKGAYSCAISVVTHDPSLTPAVIRQRLAIHEEIAHSTIEVQFCAEDGPVWESP